MTSKYLPNLRHKALSNCHTLNYEAGLYRKLGDVGVVELVDCAAGVDVMSAADK